MVHAVCSQLLGEADMLNNGTNKCETLHSRFEENCDHKTAMTMEKREPSLQVSIIELNRALLILLSAT